MSKFTEVTRAGLSPEDIKEKLFSRCYINFYKKENGKYIAVFRRNVFAVSKKFVYLAKDCHLDEIEGLEIFMNNAPSKLLNECSEFLFEGFMKYRNEEDLYESDYNGTALNGQACIHSYPLTDLGRRLTRLGYAVNRPQDYGYYW